MNVDIFAEIQRIMDVPYEICIIQETIDELEKIIKEQKGKHKEAARLALKLIEVKKLVILETKQKDLKRRLISKEIVVDDVIINIVDNNFIVATQDKELKKKLLNKGINCICLKSRKLIKNVL